LGDAVENIHRSIDGVREEMRLLRIEHREDFAALRADFSAMQRQLARIGWTVAAALTTTLVGMLATLVVASL